MKTKILKIVVLALLIIQCAVGVVNAASVTADQNTVEKGNIITVTIKTSEPVETMGFNISYNENLVNFKEAKCSLGAMANKVAEGVIKCGCASFGNSTDTFTLIFEAKETGNAKFEIGGDMIFTKADGTKIDATFETSIANVAIKEYVKVKIDNNTYSIEKGATLGTIAELGNLKIKEGQIFVNFTKNDGTVVNDNDVITADIELIANFKPEELQQPENPEIPEQPENPTQPQEPTTPENPETSTTGTNNEGDKYVDDNGNVITKLVQTGSIVPTIIFTVIVFSIISIIAYQIIKLNKEVRK